MLRIQLVLVFNSVCLNLIIVIIRVKPAPSPIVLILETERISLKEYFELVTNYVRKHREFFGRYQGELMLEPYDLTMESLQGSFADWLDRNGLTKLASTFDLLLYAPGYGYVDKN